MCIVELSPAGVSVITDYFASAKNPKVAGTEESGMEPDNIYIYIYI